MPKVRINASAEIRYSRVMDMTDEDYGRYLNEEKMTGQERDAFFERLADTVMDDMYEVDADINYDEISVALMKS